MSLHRLLEWSDGAAGPLIAAGPAENPTWEDRALCAETDPEVFFPEKGDGNWLKAKRICARCGVRAECLDYALENRIRHGVWGGVSDRDRLRMEHERAREAAA